MRFPPAVIAAACAALVPALALGVPPRTSSLSWVRLEGAESCIATQALARAVEARLHRAIFVSAAQGEVSVEGRVQRQKGRAGFRAVLHLRDGGGQLVGTRELETHGASCTELDDSLALVIAVMIDPDAALSEPAAPPVAPPAPAPLIQPVPAPLPATPPGPAPTSPPAPAEPIQTQPVVLEAGASAALGLLPGVGAGLWAAATIPLRGELGLRLGVADWLPARKALEQGAAAEQRALVGWVGLCPLDRALGPVRALACGNLRLGWVRSTGIGFDLGQEVSTAVALAGVEGRLRARLSGPLSAQLGLSIDAALRRDRVVYTLADGTSREAFALAPVVLTGDAGLAFTFP
jgi:hypothetical protein